VCFFPQLIAGPILRGDELLWQIDAGGRPSRQRARRGTWLVVVGLVKKVIFADFLLRPFVEDVFASPGIGPATFQLVALYAFTFQIYFDFAGYSDIARGVALFFGYELPLNFKEPYLSRDPTEYWRRWHITLSRWLRDYLYIPLGGNRRGRFRTYVNIMLTMLLGGLWHGASWNMVIWGGIHGVLIVVYRLFSPRHADDDRPLQVGDIVKIVVYFQFVCFAYLFFRAASFDDARLYLSTLFTGDYGGPWPLVETLIVAACAVLHVVERVARTHAVRLRETLGRSPVGTMFEALLLGSAIGAVFMLAGSGGEFIYFQF